MNYGSHASTQTIEVEADGECHEAEFEFEMECTSPGCSAQLYGAPENCYPAEAAEFELISVSVFDRDGNPRKVPWEILEGILGVKLADKLVEKAKLDAEENMEL